jgi:predicted phage terminase large subunit-like protein
LLPSEVLTATRHFYVDTSFGDNEEADRTAIISFSIYKNKMYVWEVAAEILDFNQFVGNPVTQEKGVYEKFVARHNWQHISRHIFEKKASGPSIIQFLKVHTSYNIFEDTLPGGESKRVRVQAVLPFIEQGSIKFVRGYWNDEFIKEATAFPRGRYDDMVDVLSGAIRNSDLRIELHSQSSGDKETQKPVNVQDLLL